MNKYLKSALFIIYYLIYSIVIYIPFMVLNINMSAVPDVLFYMYYISVEFLFFLTVVYIYLKDFRFYFNDFRKNGLKHLKLGFNYWIIGLSVMVISNILIGLFSPISLPENEQAVREALKFSPYFVMFSTIFDAPIIEEMLFRKALFDIFKNKKAFILVSGIAFGAFHIIGMGTSLYSWLYIIPYAALGISFAYAYVKTKNILTTICMHSFHNLITVIQILLLL